MTRFTAHSSPGSFVLNFSLSVAGYPFLTGIVVWRPYVCEKRTRFTAQTRREPSPCSTGRSGKRGRPKSSRSSKRSSRQSCRETSENTSSEDGNRLNIVIVARCSPSLNFLTSEHSHRLSQDLYYISCWLDP